MLCADDVRTIPYPFLHSVDVADSVGVAGSSSSESCGAGGLEAVNFLGDSGVSDTIASDGVMPVLTWSLDADIVGADADNVGWSTVGPTASACIAGAPGRPSSQGISARGAYARSL